MKRLGSEGDEEKEIVEKFLINLLWRKLGVLCIYTAGIHIITLLSDSQLQPNYKYKYPKKTCVYVGRFYLMAYDFSGNGASHAMMLCVCWSLYHKHVILRSREYHLQAAPQYFIYNVTRFIFIGKM